jgi:DNA helicase II / ATP-dependent DNA helicase PcrA
VANALDGLTDAQREAVTHRRSPVLVSAGAGTGKTEVLIRRLCWFAEQGLEPHRPLLIVRDEAAVATVLERVEALLDRPHEELSVHSAQGVCARLITEQAAAAGVEELTPIATAAERLAMLLAQAGELELSHHDFRGRPLALFAAFVRQIDRLKADLVDAGRYSEWAEDQGAREREFAALFAAHDRMLAERGLLDEGELLLAGVRLFERDVGAGEWFAGRHPQLLVDDWQSRSLAQRKLVTLLAAGGTGLTVAGDENQALGAGGGSMQALAEQYPEAAQLTLSHSFRCRQRVLDGAQAVLGAAAAPGRDEERPLRGRSGGEVHFWRPSSERAQAQHVAAEIEQLIAGEVVAPERCAVLVRSVASHGREVAAALAERAVAHQIIGADAFFERAEIRDVLAWLRLLVDPADAAAVVRALSRPPIGLHAVDVARCVQIARRRKLDMVAALAAALESPQIVPEARERINSFLAIQRWASAMFDDQRADLFVYRLVERLGLRRAQLFSTQPDVVERLVNLAKLTELAARHSGVEPTATPRDFAAYITVVAESGIGEAEAAAARPARGVVIAGIDDVGGLEFDRVFVLSLGAARMLPRRALAGLRARPVAGIGAADEEQAMRRALYVAMTRASEGVVLSAVWGAGSEAGRESSGWRLAEEAREALGGAWEEREEELFGPAAALQSLFRERRDELLESVARVGSRLGELRFDTDIDVAHGVVRLLELVKLAALLERREEQPIAEALVDINARLAAAATPLQREILLSSPLDELLAGTEEAAGRRAATAAVREEPSLAPFLPRRGERLMLSASDIETYRACPLRYKFARVLRIPREPTLNQRFGILVHQVLERFHDNGTLITAAAGASGLAPANDDDADGGGSLAAESASAGGRAQMLRLLDVAWRRGGFGDSDEERQLREKARVALIRYEQRLRGDPPSAGAGAGTPRWFERSFSFPLGPHQIRGRVDRIDELGGGGYELIDYKTGLPKHASELREDVQLALYSVAARETWQLEATERTYYYVLDDERVSLGVDDARDEWITGTVAEVGDGILAQRFEPTPSRAVCAMCDFRIACPAAEK